MDIDAIPPSSPPHMSTMDPPSSPFFEPQYSAFTLTKSSSPPPLFSSDDSCESVDVTNYQSPRIYKNKRKGTWWDRGESASASAHNTPEAKKTRFSRNFDSGIYLLSDASQSSESILFTHSSPFDMAAAHGDDIITDDTQEQYTATGSASYPGIAMSDQERAFNQRVQIAVDEDLETHDFQGRGLEDHHIQRIGDLAQITKHPPVYNNQSPAPGQWRSLVPEHKVLLGQNQLHRLVPALFDVQNITQLYLRHNQIEELPQDIAKLVNLDTLDVAHNHIKHLPFEVIKLLQPHGKLTRLSTFNNPLLAPMYSGRFHQTDSVKEEDDGEGAISTMDTLPLDLLREDARAEIPHLYASLASSEDREQVVWRIRYLESWAHSFDGGNDARNPQTEEDVGFYPHHPSLWLDDLDDEKVLDRAPRYIARTLVSYYDQAGNLLHGSPSLPTSNRKEDEYPIIVETTLGTYGTPASLFTPPHTSKNTPLLTTTTDRALRTETPDEIRDAMRMSNRILPPDAELILRRAEKNDAGGYGRFRKCHLCKKDYVVARAEWIEFWCAGPDVWIPVEVQVCKWSCVPKKMREQPAKELTW
jgi:Leucine-rich repeat (LRR) protein